MSSVILKIFLPLSAVEDDDDDIEEEEEDEAGEYDSCSPARKPRNSFEKILVSAEKSFSQPMTVSCSCKILSCARVSSFIIKATRWMQIPVISLIDTGSTVGWLVGWLVGWYARRRTFLALSLPQQQQLTIRDLVFVHGNLQSQNNLVEQILEKTIYVSNVAPQLDRVIVRYHPQNSKTKLRDDGIEKNETILFVDIVLGEEEAA